MRHCPEADVEPTERGTAPCAARFVFGGRRRPGSRARATSRTLSSDLTTASPDHQRPVRVAYITSRYPSISHTFISREVAAVRARGVEVTVFSLRRVPTSELLSDAQRAEHDAAILLIPPAWLKVGLAHLAGVLAGPGAYARTLVDALRSSPGGLRRTLWQLFYFGEAVVVWRESRRRGVRHLHAHFGGATADVAMVAARFARAIGDRAAASWSFTMHGPTEFSDVTHYRLAEKVADADAVVCISDYTRSQLLRLVDDHGASRLTVIRCGVDPDAFAPPDRPAASGAEPLRLICVGRLVPEKGQRILLHAIERLAARGIDTVAEVVGDGPDAADLDRLARELELGSRVHFLGAVAPAGVPERLAAADVFVLPSLAEGVPVALMEAMAIGLPVVSTSVMGIPELVTSGESGLLVRPGRADELADALGRLRDPSVRAAMGAEGRRRIATEYSVDRSAAAVTALLTRLATRGGAGAQAAWSE
jgi:colanic acid/amylovoran biosynthesis glycosyltransferase